MDYRDNFQDMIARYNRELMRAYQKRRQEGAVSEEVASAPAPVPASEEAVPASAPAPAPEEAVPASASAPEEVAPASASKEGASASAPEEVAPVCDADTRPLYPLFTKDDLPAPEAETDAEAIRTEVVSVAAVTEDDSPPEEAVETVAPASTAEMASEPAVESVPAPESAPVPAPAPTPEVGYLQIWVTTARDAVPIEGAHVTVSREENGERVAYFIGMTDRSGKTALFPLPAAAAALSQSPGAEGATYTPYNIDVYANGYYRMENLGLPMYGGIRAELPVQLIPLPENGQASDTLTFPDSGPTALSSEGGRMS